MDLRQPEIYDQSARCNRCGFCQAHCPVYQVTKREASVARAHNTQAREIAEGRLALDPEMGRSFSECLLCRACWANCYPAIRTDRVVVAARAALNGGASRWQDFVFRRLLADHRRMGRWVRALYAAQRSGAGRLAGAFRWLPLPRGLFEAPKLLPDPPRVFLRERFAGLDLKVKRPRARVVYFAGCGMNFALPQAGQASLQVLAAAGFQVALADHACCGLPAYAHGDLEAARALAIRNLEPLLKADPDLVVSDCASCSSFLKEYPRLLESPQAERLAARVRDLNEVLDPADLPWRRELPMTVTFHDPCHLSRYQELQAQPRRILQAIPGVRLIELPEADWCCGAAGVHNITHQRISIQVLGRKMKNVERTGAEVLATSCPACQLQLGYGARHYGLPVRVRHLSELIAQAVAPGQPIPPPARGC